MDISQFSTRCIFIPPMINDYVLSQTQEEDIKAKLEAEFTRLRDVGVQTVLYVGGMGLDYKRYDVSHIIPSVMVYHSYFQYREHIDMNYEVSSQSVFEEIELVDNRVTFLSDLIYNDEYNKAVMELEQAVGYQINPDDFDVEVNTALLDKYEGTELLVQWLKQQRVLGCWNSGKHVKHFKKSFEGNKTGLKFDMHITDTKYYICGNLLRKDIIFSK